MTTDPWKRANDLDKKRHAAYLRFKTLCNKHLTEPDSIDQSALDRAQAKFERLTKEHLEEISRVAKKNRQCT